MGLILAITALPEELRHEAAPHPDVESLNLQELEQRLIQKALVRTKGNKARAARLLGIDTSTLWRKLKRLQARQQ